MKIKNILIAVVLVALVSLTGCLRIDEKKEYDFSGLSFDSEAYVYDGEEHEIVLDGKLPVGWEVTYDNNKAVEMGVYKATATITDVLTEEAIKVFPAVLIIDNPENSDFETFMDELLVAVFEEDQMSVNFFFNNPENYGLGHYEPELPKYSNEGTWEEGIQELQDILDELHGYNYDQLSFEEQDTYKIVEEYFDYLISITENMNYMTNGYLGSYLGYQSNLPLNLAEYKFRNEQDIKDFIAFLNDSPAAFQSYYEFTAEQAERGYGMPDFVIDNVLSQCQSFVELGEDNYLIGIFNDKIDEVEFDLDANVVAAYKDEAKTAIVGAFTEGYQYILDNLNNLRGKATNLGGLANFGEEGKSYYEIMMNDTLGIHATGEEMIAYIDQKMVECDKRISSILTRYRSLSSSDANIFFQAAINDTPLFSDMEIDELVEYYREVAKTIVPEIEEMPNISIKLVPESLKDNFSPAAYFISAIDETKNESIYLNPAYLEDYNYIFTTLAHEGYPGHLYQNVYAKGLDINDIRRAFKCSGYSEGWATYVEMKSYFFATNYTSTPLQLALEYTIENGNYNGLLNCRIDLGIHYEGWTIDEMCAWLNDELGVTGTADAYKADDLIDMYNQLVEIPSNMNKYNYSYSIFYDLHELAETILGENFDEIEFNTVLLDDGAIPLDMMIENVVEYLEIKSFLLDPTSEYVEINLAEEGIFTWLK